ncbi:MAG: very short patch repair endonuclease [Alphaproteobacteria bacterium]|nr:very short patch repair endonuclease [Alphaproteobacteria bacterium]MBU0799264.1 very short patch repair endonuclease [Alphaproteobacteria bacterium]MBU0885547.1 very short patch repair endonuclease [Alphaproteobacteria bacterium]MBU1812976.1 very short patch repair endonuclease [Alphaproteobacteria bacterium]MBU2090889.1 very short patch repair endonuclease [Alphaproteobacteria bacterium]
MPDVVDQQTRSRMMAGIRGKDTKPELAIRRGLHARGFRFRLHVGNVPGKPDLVLPRFRAAIFVNGCFWHHHDCHLFKIPSTRTEFWSQKIARNVERDAIVREQLTRQSWRFLVVWECALKGRTRLALDDVIGRIAQWLCSAEPFLEIEGAR